MSIWDWVVIGVLWLCAASLVGMMIGPRLRSNQPPAEEHCIEGCGRVATHERLVGITTEHVPVGDPDGFSEHTELVCWRHAGENGRRRSR